MNFFDGRLSVVDGRLQLRKGPEKRRAAGDPAPGGATKKAAKNEDGTSSVSPSYCGN